MSSILTSNIVSLIIDKFLTKLLEYIPFIKHDTVKRGIFIPSNCGSEYFLKNVTSNESVFLDLDQEIISDLDDDEKKEIRHSRHKSSTLISSPKAYSESLKITASFEDIIVNSNKNIEQIVLISSDYHLLKYVKVKAGILYLLPSECFLSEIKISNKDFNDEQFRQEKEDVVKYKNSSVLIYNSYNELISIIQKHFPEVKVKF